MGNIIKPRLNKTQRRKLVSCPELGSAQSQLVFIFVVVDVVVIVLVVVVFINVYSKNQTLKFGLN